MRAGSSFKGDEHFFPLSGVSGRGSILHSQACFTPSPFPTPGPGPAWSQHRCHVRGVPRAMPTEVTPLPQPVTVDLPSLGFLSSKERLLIPPLPRLLRGSVGPCRSWRWWGGGVLAPGDRWLPLQMRPQVTKSVPRSFLKDNLEL